MFGKKFKPWEAVKIADKIGKAAKVGGFVIQIGGAGYEVWRNEREARKAQVESERQHAAFVTEIMGHADESPRMHVGSSGPSSTPHSTNSLRRSRPLKTRSSAPTGPG